MKRLATGLFLLIVLCIVIEIWSYHNNIIYNKVFKCTTYGRSNYYNLPIYYSSAKSGDSFDSTSVHINLLRQVKYISSTEELKNLINNPIYQLSILTREFNYNDISLIIFILFEMRELFYNDDLLKILRYLTPKLVQYQGKLPSKDISKLLYSLHGLSCTDNSVRQTISYLSYRLRKCSDIMSGEEVIVASSCLLGKYQVIYGCISVLTAG
jgi:hypothetical protein